METNQLPRAGEIIKSAWKSYKLFSKKMWPFYILGSIGLLAGVGYSNVSSLVQPIFQSHIGDTAKMAAIAGLFVVWIFSIYCGLVLLKALALAYKGENIGFGIAFRQNSALFWPYVVLSVSVLMATMGGEYLLLIPGISISIYLMFSLMEFVVDDKRDMAALLGSWSLVSGRWWRIFGLFLLISIILGLAFFCGLAVIGIVASVILVLLHGLGTVFTAVAFGLIAVVILGCVMLVLYPLVLLAQFELYFAVKRSQPASTVDATNQKSIDEWRRNKLVALIIVGILGMIAISFFSANTIGTNAAATRQSYTHEK